MVTGGSLNRMGSNPGHGLRSGYGGVDEDEGCDRCKFKSSRLEALCNHHCPDQHILYGGGNNTLYRLMEVLHPPT
ncbi:hypothetical protein E2C01_002266 [Portunus trituberculatus]|uniref:Uncharacterized protein n=1 Tax=Portunus trituberculatus TaxID=210409 RepID=A0A5B7CJY0_PORTR|nr:hypothetical protein [Portunus trituberculatus]